MAAVRHIGFVVTLLVTPTPSSLVREAGSGHCGESSEHPTRFRVATWNIGSLKKRDSEVVETV